MLEAELTTLIHCMVYSLHHQVKEIMKSPILCLPAQQAPVCSEDGPARAMEEKQNRRVTSSLSVSRALYKLTST